MSHFFGEHSLYEAHSGFLLNWYFDQVYLVIQIYSDGHQRGIDIYQQHSFLILNVIQVWLISKQVFSLLKISLNFHYYTQCYFDFFFGCLMGAIKVE